MHAPTPRIPRLDFTNWTMSMAAACDSCGRFAKGYSGEPSSPLRRKKSAVLYASNYSLAAVRCSRNPTAIAMALMTAPVKPRWYLHAFPPSASLDRDRVNTAPKRSGSDLMEIRDPSLFAESGHWLKQQCPIGGHLIADHNALLISSRHRWTGYRLSCRSSGRESTLQPAR
jgi:hypothetical protein